MTDDTPQPLSHSQLQELRDLVGEYEPFEAAVWTDMRRLIATLDALEADNAALMEVVRGAAHRFDDGSRAMQKALDALPAHLKQEAGK